jgi:hypothetical protein
MDDVIVLGDEQIEIGDLTLRQLSRLGAGMSSLFGSGFDFDDKVTRRRQLETLKQIGDVAQLCVERIQTAIVSSQQAYTKQISQFRQSLDAVDDPSDQWTHIARRAERSTYKDTTPTGHPLRVIRVNRPDEVPSTSLYYIESYAQFALRINNVLFRGNIGDLIGPTDEKVKIVDCNHGQRCTDMYSCTFYHDPSLAPLGPRDRRNFMHYSWDVTDKRTRYGGRRIGGAKTLDNDLIIVEEAERQLRQDQLMHDMLISLLINTHTRR